MTVEDTFPPDEELSELEQTRYNYMLKSSMWRGSAFVYEQSCLLRLRMNGLIHLTKRLERLTFFLLIGTVLLFLSAVLSLLKH